MSRRRLIGAALALVALTGCASRSLRPMDSNVASASTARTAGVENVEEMQTIVATLVPPGTSLSKAEQIMKAEGFECAFHYDDVAGRDFLRCVRDDTVALVVGRKWIVKLAYRDGAIVSTEVDTGLIGT